MTKLITLGAATRERVPNVTALPSLPEFDRPAKPRAEDLRVADELEKLFQVNEVSSHGSRVTGHGKAWSDAAGFAVANPYDTNPESPTPIPESRFPIPHCPVRLHGGKPRDRFAVVAELIRRTRGGVLYLAPDAARLTRAFRSLGGVRSSAVFSGELKHPQREAIWRSVARGEIEVLFGTPLHAHGSGA
ncbi:MAG: hypothetical protein HC933_21630 [Pleurocapsa sp. SU_196_0]|nr:hypothetical protein [Pleurocapsa sp. SU_196_0]